jgi:DNA-binding Xre family transcriptional regulator
MAQLTLLVEELKRQLRAQGITYGDIARSLGLSESSVKRMFSKQSFSLARFEQICNSAGLEIGDLIEAMNARREYLTELSPEQEDALLANPKLLLLAYLLINGWKLDEIVANFRIDKPEAQRLLVHLHRARIIDLLPFDRVKLRTSRNFTWRKDGPLQKLFTNEVQREFFDSAFDSPDEQLVFVGGMLSSASLIQLRQSIDRLAREFDELSRRDAALPLAERSGCSAVFAIRPWEFSMFTALRRAGVGSAPEPKDGPG